MTYIKLNAYSNNIFVDDKVNVSGNGIYNLFLPMFNRQVFFLKCTGAVFKILKKHKNINKTALFSVNRLHYIKHSYSYSHHRVRVKLVREYHTHIKKNSNATKYIFGLCRLLLFCSMIFLLLCIVWTAYCSVMQHVSDLYMEELTSFLECLIRCTPEFNNIHIDIDIEGVKYDTNANSTLAPEEKPQPIQSTEIVSKQIQIHQQYSKYSNLGIHKNGVTF